MSLGNVNLEVNPIYYWFALMQELLTYLHASCLTNVGIKTTKEETSLITDQIVYQRHTVWKVKWLKNEITVRTIFIYR